MPRNVKERLARIQDAIEKLVQRANDDGVLTDEEVSIIEQAKKGLKSYEKMVEKALKDGVIDSKEQNTLIDLEEKLMSTTYFTAMNDGRISDDELLLLKTLILGIDPRASVGWLEEDR